MAPGAARSRPALGALATPRPPTRVRRGATALPRARHPGAGGEGSGRKKTHVSVSGQEKVCFPPPSPALADSRGAGPAERARSALCSELGPEGEGRGGGWAPTSAPPPPPVRRPDSILAAPCPRNARLPRGRLGSPSACPRVPARTNFLRVAGPTRPAALARPGVTDASETDFPLFQRKGELARAPQPSPLAALLAAATPSCHSLRPPPRLGRGRGGPAGG
jgi:hypothetical protein